MGQLGFSNRFWPFLWHHTNPGGDTSNACSAQSITAIDEQSAQVSKSVRAKP